MGAGDVLVKPYLYFSIHSYGLGGTSSAACTLTLVDHPCRGLYSHIPHLAIHSVTMSFLNGCAQWVSHQIEKGYGERKVSEWGIGMFFKSKYGLFICTLRGIFSRTLNCVARICWDSVVPQLSNLPCHGLSYKRSNET